MKLDRRRFLKMSGGTAAAVVAAGRMTGRRTAQAAELDAPPFCLGVASGDPSHDSVVLWTRLAPAPLSAGGGMAPEPVTVRWEVARDEAFARIVRRGAVVAEPSAAHAVHVEVGDLPPDRWYWYRFTALGEQSRVGRTRTLPAPGAEDEPDRTMLGPAQERWLLDGLARSKAQWNVLAQQTIMAPFDYDVGPDEYRALDAWDGYTAARERILGAFGSGAIANPVVLAGDWHSSWVNDLDHGGRTVGSEFAGTSISSGCGWDASVRLGLPANPHVRFYDGSYRGYLLCDITPERWRTDLRIVTAPRDPASPAYLLAAFEVADGRPGARRLDAGTGVRSVVTAAAGGAGLPSVELEVRDGGGTVIASRLTDANGDASLFVPPGTYELSANGVGFEIARRTITVRADELTRADFALEAIGLRAGAGRHLPGALAEAAASDLVLENGEIAIAVSAGSEDGQLSPTTRGKPRDLAARGFADQLDWMNLPYASLNRPRGGNAWQQRTVRSTEATVEGPGHLRAAGAATERPQLRVVTDYRLGSGERAIDVTSTFSNTGATPVTVWIGDVIDHDGAGQRSGVAGHGTITSGPSDYTPAGRWIGMTGTDGQLYGLVYDDADWTAYAAGIWVMSQRQVTVEPGAAYALRRRIVATAAAREGAAWAPLDAY